jgi:large subunit ribosomal protein L13
MAITKKTTEKTITHTVDVTDMRIGRAASKIAALLLAKDQVTFTKERVADVQVIVENVDKVSIPDARHSKTYAKYSGYPGGLRTPSVKNILEKFGARKILSEAVSRMLPRNTLRSKRLKNLIIK